LRFHSMKERERRHYFPSFFSQETNTILVA
jgi:hypothetical protein